jgi:hypothetical protein
MRNRDEQAPLTCWKDIAQYMGKGVRTVQRWEQQMALPVKRPNGGGFKGPVAATPAELDQWLRSRWSERRPRKTLRQGDDSGTWTSHQSLLKTAQRLRTENFALIGELMTSLEQLSVTCGRVPGLELSFTGKPDAAPPPALAKACKDGAAIPSEMKA